MLSIASRCGWIVATGLGLGLSPIAPATVGSLGALLVYKILPLDGNSGGFFILCTLGFFLGIWACQTMVTESDHDPKTAVWDEVAGMWITCLLLPKTLPWFAAALMVTLHRSGRGCEGVGFPSVHSRRAGAEYCYSVQCLRTRICGSLRAPHMKGLGSCVTLGEIKGGLKNVCLGFWKTKSM